MARLIIDGYNLIRQVDELMRLENESLEAARSGLLKRLRAYRRYKPHQITVVFDGRSEFSERAEPFREGGITLCFSTSHEKADDVMIRLLQKHNPETIVVSSDRFVQQQAAAKGCAIMDSVSFYQKLILSVQMEMSGTNIEQTKPTPLHKRWATYKKGPSKRLPKKERRNKNRLDDL